MPDGLVILDASDRIEWCNPVAEQHFGLDRARDVGQSITYLVRQPQFVDYLQRENYSEPLILRQSRGARLRAVGAARALRRPADARHQPRRHRSRARRDDAPRFHRQRVPRAAHSAHRAGRLPRDDRGFRKRADGELLRRSLPLMTEQARRMQRLVEDLLDAVAARKLAQSAARGGRSTCRSSRARSITTRWRSPPAAIASCSTWRAGDWLLGAEEELRSAFGNLISNAVRYTPERGEVEIAWRRDGAEAVFSVRDIGHRHRRRSTFRGSPSASTAWTAAARARPAARGSDSRSSSTS